MENYHSCFTTTKTIKILKYCGINTVILRVAFYLRELYVTYRTLLCNRSKYVVGVARVYANPYKDNFVFFHGY